MKHQATSKKPKILCLHGSQSSSELLKKETEVWPPFVLEKLDLVFINGPFPLPKKSNIGDTLFTWYYNLSDQRDTSFEQCMSYIEDCMVKFGPFDGVLGFSQGAWVTASLPGMQAQGVALAKVEKIKFVMVISGGKLGGTNFPAPKLAETAFSSPIQIPSLHCFGETDIAKFSAIELLESFVDPSVIHHPGGHEIPKLDEQGLKVMLSFLDKIQELPQRIESSL